MLDVAPHDAVVMAVRSPEDFDALFACVPFFALEAPAPARLYLCIEPTLSKLAPERLRLLGLSLRSGAPFAKTWLITTDASAAQRLRRAIDLPVLAHPNICFADLPVLVASGALDAPPSLEIKEFGPITLLISALWGRVGSTTVFDNQTRFLLENGAFVVRIFVDHHPGSTHDTRERRLAENFTIVRPHINCVAERSHARLAQRRLRASADYRSASGVRRLELELEGAGSRDPGLLTWAGAAAEAAVINHASHMAFGQRITRAPIVLETHDVLADQLAVHDWPHFVSLRNEPKELRSVEEQAIWRRATACVTISPEDHAKISPHARHAVFIRPAAAEAAPTMRPWPEAAKANRLDGAFAASEDIDVLLWGDWHAGNARAVEWVLEEVRRADAALGDARFAVVGRVTRLVKKRILGQPNVVSCDFVDTLEDFFGRAKVLALADRQGSGVSIKAIDAIRFGRAFTATSAGLRGLSFDGLGYRPTDTAPAFAADLVALLRSGEARARRAAQAREIYARNISLTAYDGRWREVIVRAAPQFFARDAAAGARRRLRLAQAGAPMLPAAAPRLEPLGSVSSASPEHSDPDAVSP